MATESSFNCYCPWCCYWRVSLNSYSIEKRRLKLHSRLCKIIIVLFLLLSGSFISFPVVSSLSVKPNKVLISRGTARTGTSITSSVVTQKLSLGPEMDCLSGVRPECTCTSKWKCRKCSRFELSKEVKYCLYTGYRQYAYCPQSKSKNKKKYISCQYSNSKDDTYFWLFEGVVSFIGLLSLVVVRYRTKILQERFNRRIQRQLNA